MTHPTISNQEIAQVLENIAELLEAQDANFFRVRAYRNGANVLRAYEKPVADIVQSGDGQVLQELPQIGEGLAAIISEYVNEGHSTLLEDLISQATPAALFTTVPGIGRKLAERVVEALHIRTLQELEQAANDGRLAEVEGFGEKRLKIVRASLAETLHRDKGQTPLLKAMERA
jgi:DNA polymerase/3'-5' exonuclease PolX